MSARQSFADKVTRLLISGAVTVVHAGPGTVTATVEGDTGTWVVRYRRGGWRCPCPACGRCTHLTAVMAMTDPYADRSDA